MTTLLQKNHTKDLLIATAVLLILAAVFFGFFSGTESAANDATNVTGLPVHWHAAISYEACGQALTVDDTYKGYGDHPLLHGHNDGKVHVEGVIGDLNTVNLQKFFDNVSLDIGSDHLFTYKNGATCPGSATPGSVHFNVDGQDVADPAKIIISDDQTIKVSFQ